MFLNCSTCFERRTIHRQEIKNCNYSLWFYTRFWFSSAVMADWELYFFNRRYKRWWVLAYDWKLRGCNYSSATVSENFGTKNLKNLNLFFPFLYPYIASISLQYNQKDATFSRSIYFYKLLCMFQTVPPPIIRSTKLYIQRQVLSNRYCWLRSSNGLTNTRCCRYSCLRSWWWVVVRPETCRAVSR
jgi:hypothetical protein